MRPEDVKNLLAKYFAGETNLEEEAGLRAYFNGDDIDPALLSFQPLFRFFSAEAVHTLRPGFNRRLEERLAPPRPLLRRLAPTLARVAAVIAIALGIWWALPRPEPAGPRQQAAIDWSKYEPETPEEAYKITRRALMKVSGELNQGASTAAGEMDRVQELGRFFK